MNQMNFFREEEDKKIKFHAPLAERMRPANIEEFVGQSHLLGEGKILSGILKSNRCQSFILWGPPGCGKTTLAKLIAASGGNHIIYLSAVTAGVKEIRSAADDARKIWVNQEKRTWLFMDEIHRLNKAQQDSLLPYVEDGTLLLLGATTENPSFEVIRPLLSRTQVLVLEPLKEEELRIVITRALEDKERGLGNYPACFTEEALCYLISASGGDGRVMLNAMETAVFITLPENDLTRIITIETIKEALQKRINYDKSGEEHFNLISALHKSIRGSDPDASLYWFSRMLEGGEDPLYIARRLVRAASEDIGLADPFALMEAMSACDAYNFLGSPEGELALAQLVVYLSLAPKSNSVYTAFGQSRKMAKNSGSLGAPFHIRNAPTSLMKDLGYGKDYAYPHDDPRGWIEETYFPDELVGTVFFNPTSRGWEGKRKENLLERRKLVEIEKKKNDKDLRNKYKK